MNTLSIRLRPTSGSSEYLELVHIWRSAVDATHQFVSAEHLDQIESKLASDYLPNVGLTVAEVEGRTVGFSGVADGRLEMLFVDNDFRGCGVGTALLDAALSALPTLALDVNEQNAAAVDFYRRRGFVRTGRSPVDADGLPYPLLHMRFGGGGETRP
ncbi:putative acetyltransferase [Gordonia effusa NBRC 100432]|uniref:Putative acetyltransferase n=1 Tax=Gordonia effusa NBRC 100432 TaxID=1077974 RepID=H0R1H3_9ACTN|nr:acetyltransferase [Gordonia effusa]GAB18924.1 putative acetyltransferase [Gordonia effusa NBRC 100432]